MLTKKVTSLFKNCLILFLVLSIISGCSNTSNTSTSQTPLSEYENFITVDVFCSQANYQGIQSGWFGQVIKDKFNMELNIIAPNVAGGGDTLFQTRLAAGNIGDIVMINTDNNGLTDSINAGVLLDLSDYEEMMPDVMNYSNAIQRIKAYHKGDGFYAIPSSVSSRSAMTPGEATEPTFGPYLRWDLYTDIGSPTMSTLEDLLPVLEEIKESYPETDKGDPTYGFSFFKDWDGNIMMMGKQPACFYGYDETGFVLSKVDGSDYQSVIDSNSFYIRVLKFYHNAYLMGLIDPDSPTQNWDDVWKKYENGQIFYSPWPWLGQSAYNTNKHLNDGKGFMLATIDDMEILSYGSTPEGSNYVVGIGSKAQDPERMAAFINWLYSPEGVMLSTTSKGSTSGPEGLTWEMVNNRPELTDFGITAFLEGDTIVPDEWGGGSWHDGMSQLNFQTVLPKDINTETGFPYDFKLWESYIEYMSTPVHQSWQEQTGALTTFEYLNNHGMIIVKPGTHYIPESDPSSISTIRADVRSVIVDYSWSMVFAKDDAEFYSLLEEMQSTAYELGYDEVFQWDLEIAKKADLERDKARN